MHRTIEPVYIMYQSCNTYDILGIVTGKTIIFSTKSAPDFHPMWRIIEFDRPLKWIILHVYMHNTQYRKILADKELADCNNCTIYSVTSRIRHPVSLRMDVRLQRLSDYPVFLSTVKHMVHVLQKMVRLERMLDYRDCWIVKY
jgi:DNA-binding sugar fermentation-stimulating protein